jgi:hypothetical protein
MTDNFTEIEMNPDKTYTLGPVEKQVVEAFVAEAECYGERRMTPELIRKRLSDPPSRQALNYALGQLSDAEWVCKLSEGLYQLVYEPELNRDDSSSKNQ